MPEALRITQSLSIPLAEVVVRASRSSGPGGQHANVTASRIEVSFDVRASATLSDGQRSLLLTRLGPVVRAVSQDGRSQSANRQLALERLAGRITAALRVQKKRTPTRPTRASKRRRLDAKRQTADRKQSRRRPAADD